MKTFKIKYFLADEDLIAKPEETIKANNRLEAQYEYVKKHFDFKGTIDDFVKEVKKYKQGLNTRDVITKNRKVNRL